MLTYQAGARAIGRAFTPDGCLCIFQRGQRDGECGSRTAAVRDGAGINVGQDCTE
jgi:hypothetical protein